MDFKTNVADVIRGELARRRKTQVDLADVLHLSTASVTRRMTGEVPFDLDELAATARFLRTSPSRLIREAERAASRDRDLELAEVAR